MIRLDDDHLLMIEPTRKAHPAIIDSVTRRVCAAMRRGLMSRDVYRGWHTCVCGARSDNRDHYVSIAAAPTLLATHKTNSLAIHYVACHRDEITESELAKIRMLPDIESDPLPEELYGRGLKMRERSPADSDLEC